MKQRLLVLCCLFALGSCAVVPVPSPTPPVTRAPAPAPVEAGDYAAIDRHALAAPASLRGDVEGLTAYLVRPARNDFERARAIYRWITHNIGYDADGYFRGELPQLDAEATLREGRAVCFGYAGLFAAMARAAGLEAVSVRGKSKGYSYQNRRSAGPIPHAWNAVRLGGRWHLLDSTWGAGYLDGAQKSFVRRFQQHYFLTPPEEFILDHFPEAPRWQLLESRVSEREFDAMVYLRPAFFQNGLKLLSHTRGHIDTRDDPLRVALRAPDDHYLSARLLRGNEKLSRDLVRVAREGSDYRVEATFPGPGEYRLRVYAKQGLETREFDWALDYTVTKR